jgi:putative ABC transport system permease protein
MPFEHWLQTLRLRWRSLARRRQVEQDLDDEIQYHLERQIEEQMAAGLDRDEARRAVLRNFGGVEQAKERCRDARHVNFVETLVQDGRYAVRTLRRNPGFTTVAVLTLALGTGANSAAFSLVDGILLKRLPYAAPGGLVSVTGFYPNGAFAVMRDTVKTLDVAVYAEGHWFTLTRSGDPARLEGTRISTELFPMLGVKPALGRWLRQGEDVAARDQYVILSHALWETRFGAAESILGRFIELDGVAREVIAVMPPSFQFPSARTQVWVPLGLDSQNTARYWAGDFMPVVGRLRPGATLAAAHADIRLFQSQIVSRFPFPMPADWNKDVTVVPLQDKLVGDVRPRLLIMIAAVALVLVIACANVTNLCLSRAASREREIGIRTAIGASPRRIARQMLTESLVLALLGAAVGLLVATQALAVLKLVLPADTPRLAEVRLNWRVLGFTGGLAILTGCVVGLAPALQALRLRVLAALGSGAREGGRAVAGWLRAALTVAQVACAVLLVIAAGLLVRSLWILSKSDPGFRADQVVTARISPTESLCSTVERCLAFYRILESQVQSSPDIVGAALVNTLPLTGAVAKRSLELEGYTLPASRKTAPLFWMHAITPDYFRVMDIRVETGRAFTREDLTGPPVALVSSSTARRFWPGENPVGRHVRFIGERRWHAIVGVVSDVRAYDLRKSVPDWIDGTLYVPHGPNATMEDGRIPTDMTLTIRTATDGGRISAMLRRVVSATSGDVVVGEVRSMRAVLAEAAAAPAATTSVLVTMAGLALVLGGIGVYGVLSFLVSRQTRDFGIRLALGAQRRDVFWLVIKQGATLSAAGIAVGVVGALGTTRWLRSELHGVSPLDPVTYAAVAIAVSVVALMACYVPTRRAMGVDPLIVLRDQ